MSQDEKIAGVSVQCRDFRGEQVITYKMSDLGDVGRAGVVNRVPIIVMDTQVLQRLPAKLQLFFYLHECGHHVLGHWASYAPGIESEADCWAIKHGRDEQAFRRQDVVDFAPWLRSSKGSIGHLPGPERANLMLQCFDEP